ncbi:hypothetical protein STIAU_3662 [Stigmatella aurantiaca DW4/3-1]|uniref:Pesticidal crystal protein Cry22Aa Ig-like domain-containing protein n=2 Tax=Stigmatella aurantiaca (strain DW4/3-1) TaxID=378806 RepID=Q09CH5_STIAD|nr:hypothetical protein STIAU_3662 [Stigmatella aurantiaca DW4/3-1]
MMKHGVMGTIAGAFVVLCGLPAFAQTRTPWQMHNGLEVSATNPNGFKKFTCNPTQHGQICEYDVATIPPQSDSGWAIAPNGETIGFSIPSRVCQAPIACLGYGDFTYFQTLVDVPANVAVTQFTIAFSGMDDGSRVTIFNSQYPAGLVIPGSYVYFGGSGTTNLGPYVKSGEINRVVVTQVDDCCSENNLDSAIVVLNGEPVGADCHSDLECDDGNACTADICQSDGSCVSHTLACVGGELCNPQPPTLSALASYSSSNASQQSSSTCEIVPSNIAITLNGPQHLLLECGVDSWVDQGAQASDACGAVEVITHNSGHDAYGPGPNTCSEGTYSVQYRALDAQNNEVQIVRSVQVEDTLVPALTLKGSAHEYHKCGSQWVDPGAESFDECYGNISAEVKTTGYVNGWVPGLYTVTYSVTDSGGNSATPLTRTVEVANCPW